MSLVLGVADKNIAIIISDGRAKNSISNLVISENCDKTRKINDNVVLGFSGVLEFSLEILGEFERVHRQNIPDLKSDNVANILCKIAKEGIKYRKRLNVLNRTNFQMIVTGINSKNVMSLYNFGVPTNFEIQEYIPTAQDFIYSILHPENTELDLDFEKIMIDHPKKELGFYVDMLFSEASKMDDSINTNLFIKSIELK